MNCFSKYFFLIIVLLLCFACNSKLADKPAIDKEEFIQILTDIHLAEASMMNGNPFEKGRGLSMIMEYDKIFDKNKVSREDFIQTFNYYKQHPKEMDELYNDISERMTVKEAEVSSQERQQVNKSNQTKNNTEDANK